MLVHQRGLAGTVGRRAVLAGTAALATTLWSGRVAAAPRRLSVGRFEIAVFSDGFITLPGTIIAPEASPAELDAILARLGGHNGHAAARVNVPLIRAADELILVDTGSGDKFQPTAGRLLENLAAAGIDPGAVTRVVLTHAHPDHSGGILRTDGRLAFPNAAYDIGAAEWEAWMAPGAEGRIADGQHAFVAGARRDLSAIRERVRLVQPGDDIVTGMRVLDTPGHTPGHISLALEGGDGLVITGDALTNPVVSFEHPAWRFGFDMDPDRGLATRGALIARLAADRTPMLGYHLPGSGIGYAEPVGRAFRFVPAA